MARKRSLGSGKTGAISIRFRQPSEIIEIQERMREAGVSNAGRMNFRNLQIRAGSINVAENGEVTGTAVIASNQPVEREIYVPGEGWQICHEILEMTGVNLERASIIPLLIDHRQSAASQIGDWSNFRIDPADQTQMLADFRISPDDDAKTIRERIAGGYIKTFSCAYDPTRVIQEEVDGKIILRVMAWTLYEVSAVAVPADLRSTARSFSKGVGNMAVRKKSKGGVSGQRGQRSANPVTVDTSIEDNLDLEDEIEDEIEDSADDDAGDDDAGDVSERSDENDLALRGRARSLGIPGSFLRRHLGTEITPREFTRAWRAHEAANDARESSRSMTAPAQPIIIDGRRASQDRIIARAFAASDVALAAGRAPEITPEMARALPGVNLERGLDARAMLRFVAARHNVQLPPDIDGGTFMQLRSIAPAAISDFANLLTVAVNTLQADQAVALPYWGEMITRRAEFDNYAGGRFHSNLVFDELLPTKPGSEIKGGGIGIFDSEGAFETLNRRFSLTRVLFNMNGMGMFSNMNTQIQNAGTTGENKMLQRKLLRNPVMSDSLPFFHGDRYNVATGVPISVEGIGMIQAAAFGDGSSSPFVYAIANPANALALEKLSTKTVADEAAKVNPFGGKFTAIPMPGMPRDAVLWIMDPRVKAAFLRMVMRGQDRPLQKIVESSQYDGFELVASLDRGVAHGDPMAAFLAFTGDEPEDLPDGTASNYEAVSIDEVLDQRSTVDFSN